MGRGAEVPLMLRQVELWPAADGFAAALFGPATGDYPRHEMASKWLEYSTNMPAIKTAVADVSQIEKWARNNHWPQMALSVPFNPKLIAAVATRIKGVIVSVGLVKQFDGNHFLRLRAGKQIGVVMQLDPKTGTGGNPMPLMELSL